MDIYSYRGGRDFREGLRPFKLPLINDILDIRLAMCYSGSWVRPVAEQESKNIHTPTRTTLTVRACVIRDGTPGISLSMGREVIGEWTDSRARTLSLTDDYKVGIHGADGELLHLFSVPGKTLSAEPASDTEVAITFEI